MDKKLNKILRASGNRLTVPRQKIFTALYASDAAIDIRTIMAFCPSVDRTSIYRTLELFVRLNIAHIVPHGWKQLYELSEPFKPHHHHFTCTNCETVLSIMSADVEKVLRQLERSQGIVVSSHTFEVHGLCTTCASTNTSK